ncbi:MAG: right-handed parallel beta-helix repeat-containing protein [Bacteroidota bacterium]
MTLKDSFTQVHSYLVFAGILIGVAFLSACNELTTSSVSENNCTRTDSIHKQAVPADSSEKKTSINDLLANLDNETIIELQPGDYCVNDLDTNKYGKYYKWAFYFDGVEMHGWGKTMLVFRGMDNITIRGLGEKPDETKIFSNDEYAIVLTFINCKNVVIENLWVGHITTSESCFGGVLSFVDCGKIKIQNTKMYGTGFYGFEAINSEKVICENSEIWDCSGGVFHIYSCDEALIAGGNFHDNTSRNNMVNIINTRSAKIINCSFTGNEMDNSAQDNQAMFNLNNASLEVINTQIRKTNTEVLIRRRKGDTFYTEGLDTLNNIFTNGVEVIY